MRTTKFVLFAILFFTLSTTSYAAVSQIKIEGKNSPSGGPSRVPAAPSVEAYLHLDAISICFLNDLGNVSITITSETGETVYQSTEASGYGVIALIDLHELERGNYTIHFSDGRSFYRYGEFSIDH